MPEFPLAHLAMQRECKESNANVLDFLPLYWVKTQDLLQEDTGSQQRAVVTKIANDR